MSKLRIDKSVVPVRSSPDGLEVHRTGRSSTDGLEVHRTGRSSSDGLEVHRTKKRSNTGEAAEVVPQR
jgi:hypothetical protein